MKVTLFNRPGVVAQASGDTIRRALNNLADHPSMGRRVADDEWDALYIEFVPDAYEEEPEVE